jgi:hypothetical protein
LYQNHQITRQIKMAGFCFFGLDFLEELALLQTQLGR